MFNNGRTNVHDETRPRHPSLITVNTWLNEVAAEEYNKEIVKLVNRYNKCLNKLGDYVEK